MGNYTNALKYIKERKDEKHEIIHEWEVSKKQWRHCMESIFKEYILWMIIGIFVCLSVLAVIFFISFLLDTSYNVMKTAKLILFALPLPIIVFSLTFLLKFIPLYYPEQYKFFMDNHGIFNGLFYAHLKYLPDTVTIISEHDLFRNKYSSCERYKLFEHENKFEIKIAYFTFNWGRKAGVIFKEEWFCLMFNDKDKKIIYKIIKDWQEDGKIEPYEYSDRLILEKYFDKIG
jgi:hypothetical protein